jgi:F-type H+-transporting ATPase subunit c
MNELSIGGGLGVLGIGLMVGLAGMGAALGQSRAAGLALEGMGRNPAASGKLFVPMLISISFIETVLIFCWILGFVLSGKI